MLASAIPSVSRLDRRSKFKRSKFKRSKFKRSKFKSSKGFVWRLVFILITVFALPTLAQEHYTWDDFVDEFTTDDELAEEENWTLFLEELKMRHEHPLNINTATREELSQLPFLSENQIEQIHAYIYLHGTLKSLGELRLIPLIDEDTRRKLGLFVFAGDNPVRKHSRA